jgi:hypothetical protein
MSSITLQLHPEAERRLKEKADQSGQTLEAYLQQLVERDAFDGNGPPAEPATGSGPTFEEMTALLARAVDATGMTEDEVADFFEEALKEVRAERRSRQGKPA